MNRGLKYQTDFATAHMPDVYGRPSRPQATLSGNVQIEIPVVVPSAAQAGGSGGGLVSGMPVFRDRVHGSPDSYDTEVAGWVMRHPEELRRKGLGLDFPSAQLAGFSCTSVDPSSVGEEGDKRDVNLLVTGYRTFYNNGPTVLVPEEHVYVFPYDLVQAIAHVSGNEQLLSQIERLDNRTGVFLGSSSVAAMLTQMRTVPPYSGEFEIDDEADVDTAVTTLRRLAARVESDRSTLGKNGVLASRSVFDSVTEYLMSLVPGPAGRYVGRSEPLSAKTFQTYMVDDAFYRVFTELLEPVLRFASCPAVGSQQDDVASDPLPSMLRQPFGPIILHEACKRARYSVQAYYAGTVRQSSVAGPRSELEMYIAPPASVLDAAC